MKYFLDSAKLDEIKYALKNWGINGVTSNPKHVKTSGKSFSIIFNRNHIPINTITETINNIFISFLLC